MACAFDVAFDSTPRSIDALQEQRQCVVYMWTKLDRALDNIRRNHSTELCFSIHGVDD